ncbi:hypothetical protein BHE74_00048154 [Ensete ventricosum]|nr:hypothetical protein BHE74_00048154 [Ensete ventricosum]
MAMEEPLSREGSAHKQTAYEQGRCYRVFTETVPMGRSPVGKGDHLCASRSGTHAGSVACSRGDACHARWQWDQ